LTPKTFTIKDTDTLSRESFVLVSESLKLEITKAVEDLKQTNPSLINYNSLQLVEFISGFHGNQCFHMLNQISL
jgi:hypothetical protein